MIPVSPHFHQKLIFAVFNCRQSSKWVNISHWGFNLHFNMTSDFGHFPMCSLVTDILSVFEIPV